MEFTWIFDVFLHFGGEHLQIGKYVVTHNSRKGNSR
jgi:hypothetical protein